MRSEFSVELYRSGCRRSEQYRLRFDASSGTHFLKLVQLTYFYVLLVF